MSGARISAISAESNSVSCGLSNVHFVHTGEVFPGQVVELPDAVSIGVVD